MVTLLEIFPVLAFAVIVVCLPLLADGPPSPPSRD
jgi:hypothetical protein